MPKGERRLAAIMFTDMVGFTSLAQSNEELAMRELKRHNGILRPIIRRHHGREVKTMGDAFLVEFGSALEATLCAIEVQGTFHRNDSKSERELSVRIGIHAGDVIHKKGDVFGDAVNIASRIERMAGSGEICISVQVFDQVRNKVSCPLDKLESHDLKNVTFPIDLYRVRLPWQNGAAIQKKGPVKPVPLLKFVATTRPTESRAMNRFISKLALKDRVIDVKITNDPSIPSALARFSEAVDYGRGETLHIVSTIESVAVIADSKNLQLLCKFVPEKNILGVRQGLAEIIITFSESTLNTVGLAATITGELARNGVNILEYVTSWDHAIVVVDDNQALKSYEALRRLMTKKLPRFPQGSDD